MQSKSGLGNRTVTVRSTTCSTFTVASTVCQATHSLCALHRTLCITVCAAGSVIVARDGGWKLAGFEFVSSSVDGFGGSSTPPLAFEYTSAHPSPWEEYSQVCRAMSSGITIKRHLASCA